jgi:large subunit ribosomal protein L29
MKTSELRDMDDGELLEHLATARRELFGLRFQHATGELDNTSALGHAKREIARSLTIARERGLGDAAGVSTPVNETTETDG